MLMMDLGAAFMDNISSYIRIYELATFQELMDTTRSLELEPYTSSRNVASL